MDNQYQKIVTDGLWTNNPGLVQLLGLCPLLAVSGTIVNAITLGLATTLVLIGSNVTVSTIRHIIRPELRIPVFVIIIASFVTAIELLMKGFLYDLYLIIGIFIPLIVTNCAIIARAESFASKNNVYRSFIDGLSMGLGFTVVLILLGGLREIFGYGTLFAGIELMLGDSAKWMTISLFGDYRGFLLAILPPGAFIALGCIIAAKNVINKRQKEKITANVAAPIPVSRET